MFPLAGLLLAGLCSVEKHYRPLNTVNLAITKPKRSPQSLPLILYGIHDGVHFPVNWVPVIILGLWGSKPPPDGNYSLFSRVVSNNTTAQILYLLSTNRFPPCSNHNPRFIYIKYQTAASQSLPLLGERQCGPADSTKDPLALADRSCRLILNSHIILFCGLAFEPTPPIAFYILDRATLIPSVGIYLLHTYTTLFAPALTSISIQHHSAIYIFLPLLLQFRVSFPAKEKSVISLLKAIDIGLDKFFSAKHFNMNVSSLISSDQTQSVQGSAPSYFEYPRRISSPSVPQGSSASPYFPAARLPLSPPADDGKAKYSLPSISSLLQGVDTVSDAPIASKSLSKP